MKFEHLFSPMQVGKVTYRNRVVSAPMAFGLIVQNPFGIGYASVIAAARTVLEIGNEADVNTGYIWADRDNMEEETVQAMLYE